MLRRARRRVHVPNGGWSESAPVEQALEQVLELAHVHRLGQVGEEAGVEAQLTVALLTKPVDVNQLEDLLKRLLD